MDIFGIAASAVVSVVSILGGAVTKSIFDRLTNLENKTKDYMTEAEIRQLLEDKLEVVKSDHHDNREAIKRLFELYLNSPSEDT